MILTLIGDSLTAGKLGVAYADWLNLPDDTDLINLGKDGDTVRGVRDRLSEALSDTLPDILVIEAGANDILLPEMKSRGGEWASFVADMEKRGSRPAESTEKFESTYRDMLSICEAKGIRCVIAVTIPPLGEGPAPLQDKRRKEMNRIILKLAEEHRAEVADVACLFEEVLENFLVRSDWFFDSPSVFTTDLRRIRRDRSAMPLSEERGLYLTVDGAHLNEKGAEMMGIAVSNAVFRCLEGKQV